MRVDEGELSVEAEPGWCSSRPRVLIVANVDVLSGMTGAANRWLILPGPGLIIVGVVWGVVIRNGQRDRYDALLSLEG